VKQKLSQQKNLYEAVKTDRNLYSKNCLESNDEIAEMKRKFRSMSHQIEALKEEIKEKDQLLIKEHFEKNKVKKSSEAISDNLKKANKRMSALQTLTDNQKQEVKRLESSIQEAEQEQQNQRKEFDQVTSERNILGTQLIRRNDERKRQVYELQRELLQERTKVKALSEELENPMNVHRWRKLEGSDPATYELLQKVKTLQSRLIHKSEEVLEKDQLMMEKEKAYTALKTVLARQPGPEIAEQVVLYKDNLSQKSRQMRAMVTEVKTYQAQVNEYKDEVSRVNRELQQVKRKFFEQKKREQQARDLARPEVKIKIQPNLQLPRYAGGGFCLSNPVRH
jgi:chromosome segregation ATPase